MQLGARRAPATATPARMSSVYDVPSTTPMGRCGIWSVIASNCASSTARAPFSARRAPAAGLPRAPGCAGSAAAADSGRPTKLPRTAPCVRVTKPWSHRAAFCTSLLPCSSRGCRPACLGAARPSRRSCSAGVSAAAVSRFCANTLLRATLCTERRTPDAAAGQAPNLHSTRGAGAAARPTPHLHTQSAWQDSRCGEPGARPRNGAPALQESRAAARSFYWVDLLLGVSAAHSPAPRSLTTTLQARLLVLARARLAAGRCHSRAQQRRQRAAPRAGSKSTCKCGAASTAPEGQCTLLRVC